MAPALPTYLGAFVTLVIVLTSFVGRAWQVPAQYSVERASSGHTFTEGPAWSPEGFLLFSDIPPGKIHRFTPGKGTDVFRAESQGANGNAFDAQGRLYTCESRSRRVTRTDKKGNIEVLAERFEGKKLNAPNDIVVRRDGNVYFTDPAFGQAQDGRELDFFGVYRITPERALELVAKPTGRPNGIALTADGRRLYVANSDEKNVRAYDLDRQGRASNERVVVEKIEGVPDGMKVDAQGNLYVTAKALFVYSPEGKELRRVELAETPANCAFGDPDLQSLYITARTSVYRLRLEAKGYVPFAAGN